MVDFAAAIVAGAAITVALLAASAPLRVDDLPGGHWMRHRWAHVWEREEALVSTAGWPGLDVPGFVYAQIAAGAGGAAVGVVATGLVALAVPAAIGAAVLVRLAVARRAHATRIRRQDAVLEAVRMLRQLLETGAANVQQAIAMLGERGPEPLRNEFRVIAATTL